MINVNIRSVASVAALTVGLGGCTVGPDYKRPPLPLSEGYVAVPLPAQTTAIPIPTGDAQRFLVGGRPSAKWWTALGSPALTALVEEAMAANPDVEAAQAALRAAQETYRADRGALFPTVGVGVTGNRQKVPAEVASPQESGASVFNIYTGQVSVGYTPDLFGGIRRGIESSHAQVEAQRLTVEATYLTLSTNVVNAALQEAALRGQLAVTEDLAEGQASLRALLQKQFELGAIARGDVVAQDAALAQTQATLPPLRKALAQQRNALAILLGRAPGDQPAATFDLASFTLPRDLPVSMPAQLLEQRPDIRIAEENLRSVNAQYGVAIANRLPNLTLSADTGVAGETFAALSAPGGFIYNLTAGLLQPVFDAGTLKHRASAARALRDQAAAQYRGTVLIAFQNVADALEAIRSDSEALAAQSRAERSAAESLAIGKRRVALGDVDNAFLLQAQTTYLEARLAVIEAQAARFSDTVALFQALGGGWDNGPQPTKLAGASR
ncbi:MAG: efflux transporter outer membrane subunit [Pseudomonadota bacterium]